MNTAILIASRELRARARLFLIAAVMAVVPFVAVFALRENRQTGIAAVAAVLAIGYSGALALMLGVSTIGRELSEQRMTFLFAKPISPAAIWLGKAAAAFLICIGAFAIITLPAFLLARDGWRDLYADGGSVVAAALTLVLCAVLFFGGHAASTMVRSRSSRIALDAGFLAIAVIALLFMVRALLFASAVHMARSLLIGVGIAVLLLLLIAPVWQLARGRIDPKRGHAVFSTVLWCGVAIILALASVFVRWVIAPPLTAMEQFFGLEQTQTGWAVVSGIAPSRGSFTSHLVNLETGEHERLALPPMSHPFFSGDGRVMAWLEDTSFFPRAKQGDVRDLLQLDYERRGTGAYRLHTRRLERGARQKATSLIVRMPRHAKLSHDGARIAIVTTEGVQVYEVATGRLLAATRESGSTLHFVTPNVLRIASGDRMSELDIANKRVATHTGHSYLLATFSADGSRFYSGEENAIVDARTNAVVAKLPVEPEKWFDGRMLRDGSVLVSRERKLFHVDRDGHLVSEIAIPMSSATVVGQLGASKVLMAHQGEMAIVDLATKRVTATLSGIRSSHPGAGQMVLPQFPEDATFLGVDREDRFVLWSARDGAKRGFVVVLRNNEKRPGSEPGLFCSA
jgi:ABC-type transport system involved in multi-copper enzyme maturation permease subunit